MFFYLKAVHSQNFEKTINKDSLFKIIEKSKTLINKKDSLNIKKGIELLSEAEYQLEDTQEDYLKLKLYQVKTDFYLFTKNLSCAKINLDRNLPLLKAKNLPLEKGIYYKQLGNYYGYSNQKNKAIECYEKAEKLLSKYGDIENVIDNNYNLAYSYYLKKQWKKSLFYSLNLLKVTEINNNIILKKKLTYFILENLCNLNRVKEAEQYFKIINNYLKEEQSFFFKYRFNYALGVYYNSIKSYKNANNHFKNATDFSSIYYSNKNIEHRKAEDLKYLLDFEYQRNQRFKAVNKLHKVHLKHSKILGILALTLIGLLLVLISIFYKNIKFKEQINIVLTENNTKLKLANNKAEQALKIRSDFLKTITHELRTPINTIIGISYLLNSVKLDQETKNHIKTLTFSGNYLLAFVNNIINLNDDKKLFFFEPENLKDMLYTIIETYKLNTINNNKTHCYIDNNIPDKLLVDKLKTSQVIFNLLNNAYKFTRNGDINFSAKLILKNKKKASIRFIIKDTGIGIPHDIKEQIFLPYNQGDKDIQKKYGGNGIGLTVVKDILTLFKTEISLQSELNTGSTFSFCIDFDIPETKNNNKNNVIEFKRQNSENLNILLVEDNKINQLITKKILNGFGFNCDIASYGHEAIKMANHKNYHLILMDIMMPDMDGFQTTKRIKKTHPNINIIALTALSDTNHKHEFKMAGIKSVLTKPLQPKELYKQIMSHVYLDKVL